MSGIDYDGHAELLMATRDITDRKRTQAELQAAQQQFRTAFADAAGRHGARPSRRLSFASSRSTPRSARSSAGPRTSWRGWTSATRPTRPTGRSRKSAYASLRNRAASTFELEQRFLRSDGASRVGPPPGTIVTDDPNRDPLLITQVADITDRKAAEAQIAHQALHDPLTDLPNRTLFFDRAAHAIAPRSDRRHHRGRPRPVQGAQRARRDTKAPTRCSWPSRCDFSRCFGRATRSPGSAVTSSSCSPKTWSTRARPSRRPTTSTPRSPNRWPSPWPVAVTLPRSS